MWIKEIITKGWSFLDLFCLSFKKVLLKCMLFAIFYGYNKFIEVTKVVVWKNK